MSWGRTCSWISRGGQYLWLLPVRLQIEAYETFRTAGGSIHVPSLDEKKAFQDTAAPMNEWFSDRYGDE